MARIRPLMLALIAMALVSAMAMPALPARAHADYDRSFPGTNATLPVAPARVDIWFTQDLFRRLGANTIEVYAPDGSRADRGDFVLDENDRKHASVGLKLNLPPGSYTVKWTSLSATDGDSAAGSFSFSIDPNAPEPALAPGAGSGAPPAGVPDPPIDRAADGEGLPPYSWALIAAAAMLSAGALGAWALLGAGPRDGP